MNKIHFIFLVSIIISSCKSVDKTIIILPESSKLYHEGVRNYLAGSNEQAHILLSQALNISMGLDAAAYLKSQMYLDDGQLDEASRHLLLAAQIDPTNTHYTSEVAFMYGQMHQYDKAAEVFVDLIKRFPSEASNYYGAYQNYLQAKNFKKATWVLDQQTLRFDFTPEIAFNRYKVFVAWGKKKEAEEALEKGFISFPDEPLFLANMVDLYMQNQDFEKAFPLLELLCKEDPQNGIAKMVLGEIYLEKGMVERGEGLLRECINLEGPTTTQKSNILSQFQKMYGCTTENLSLHESFVTLFPQEVVGFTLLGDLYIICKNNPKAIVNYMKALEIEPNAFPIWQQLSYLLYHEKSWKALFDASEKCIALFPVQPYPYLTKGISLNKQEQFKEAETSILNGLDLIINQPIIESELKFQLGVSKFHSQDETAALNLFSESLQLQKENYPLKADCAIELLGNKKYYSVADSLITFCLERENKNPKYLAIKGRFCYLNDTPEKAISYIEEAIKNGHDLSIAEEWLGDCFESLGDLDKALMHWQNAIKNGNTTERLYEKIKIK